MLEAEAELERIQLEILEEEERMSSMGRTGDYRSQCTDDEPPKGQIKEKRK